MKRTFVAVAAAFLMTMGTALVGASPAAAAGCSAGTSQRLNGGGFIVTVSCPNGFISGYGSTLDDANREALLLYQFSVTGRHGCTGSSEQTTSGGYIVLLSCQPGGFVLGYGSTVTDAAVEARSLAMLSVSVGRNCTGSSKQQRTGGGWIVTVLCTPGGFISGVGSTLTGAAQNARLAASI